jgi:hypothetical protein
MLGGEPERSERLETLMPSLFRTPTPRVLMSSILLAILWQALSIGARAEVLVTGEPDAVQVDAKEASVEELLSALRKAYGLQYWSSANLSRSVSGTYAGSLQQVVSRVLSLQGYYFIAETSEHGTIVAVYDKSAAPGSNVNLVMSRPASPPPKPAPPSPMAAAAQRCNSGH